MVSATIGGKRYTASDIQGSDTAAKQTEIYRLLDILKTEQNTNWAAYNAAQAGSQAQTNALDAIKTTAQNQSNLYQVAADITVLNKAATAVAADYENSRNLLSGFASEQLAEATANAAELISANDGKKRMIELNTYYGKRFNAQAGVVKLFIYTCVPVLILAILANAGLIPTTIAGFIIVIIIVYHYYHHYHCYHHHYYHYHYHYHFIIKIDINQCLIINAPNAVRNKPLAILVKIKERN